MARSKLFDAFAALNLEISRLTRIDPVKVSGTLHEEQNMCRAWYVTMKLLENAMTEN